MSSINDGDIISLNVGGKIFSTTACTLRKFPESQLGIMFSKEQKMSPTKMDNQGNYFIDASPEYFDKILEIYRTGKFPKNPEKGLRKDINRWFPGTYTKSSDEKFAKKVAKGIIDSWNEESRATYTSQIPPAWMRKTHSTLSIIKKIHEDTEHAYAAGFDFGEFAVYNSLSEEYATRMSNTFTCPDTDCKHTSGCYGEYDFSESFVAVESDPVRYKKCSEILDYMHNCLSVLEKPETRDAVCMYINRYIPEGFKCIWFKSAHTLERESDDVNSIEIAPGVPQTLYAEEVSHGLFPDLSSICGYSIAGKGQIEKWNGDSEFANGSCYCGENKTYNCPGSGLSYFCIYPERKYEARGPLKDSSWINIVTSLDVIRNGITKLNENNELSNSILDGIKYAIIEGCTDFTSRKHKPTTRKEWKGNNKHAKKEESQ